MVTNKGMSEPIFCQVCGNRIGWRDDGSDRFSAYYCDECAEKEYGEGD